MKKSILSIVLVLSMLFSLSVPAFAADADTLTLTSTSTSIEEKYSDAGDLMKSLGIMVGYTDGKLHLENNITRAEFVTMIVRTLGYDYLIGSTENKFTDVSETHWAKDYIAIAHALGLVAGVGNNKFNPDANVTIVEAETVLLRVLGYGELADKIGWPNGYTIYASQTGMTENIDIWNHAPATRGHLAQLIANTLDIPFYSYFNQNKGNILTTYLDYEVVEGTITDTALTDSDLELNEVKIDDKYYTFDSDNTPAYIGEDVEGYMNEDGEVLYLKTVDSEIVLGFVDSLTSKKIEIDNKYYNFAKEYDVYINNKDSNVNYLDLGALAKLVFDEDGKVVAIYGYEFNKDSLMISDITEKYIKVFDYSTASNNQYSIKNKQIIVYKNGKFGGIDTLNKEDIVAVTSTSDSLFFYASNNGTVDGKLNSISSSKGANIGNKNVKFADNVTYSVNNNNTIKKVYSISDLSALIGLRVTAVLNHNNEIIHIYAEQADENKSVGIVVDKVVFGNKYIEIFDVEDGEFESYYYTSKTNKYNDDNAISYNDLKVFGEDNTFSFVEITYSDEEITTISSLDVSAEVSIQKIYNSSIKTSNGVYYVSNDTVVVRADEGTDELSIIDWASVKNTSVNDNVKIVVVTDEDSIEAEYIIITDGYEYIGDDIEYGVVASIGRSIYGDFYELYTLDGDKSITLKNDASNTIQIGDVISYRMNIDDLAVDVKEMNKTYDVISYIIDEEYIELEKSGDYFELHSDAMIFNTLEEDYLEDQIIYVWDLEVGDAIEYVVNNENEIIYVAVVEELVPSVLLTDISLQTFTVGVPTEFTFVTIANDDFGRLVVGTSNFSNTDAIEKLEYFEPTNNTWYELTGEFGGANGFPLMNASSKFRVTFKTAGTYSFTANMKAVEDGSTVCETTVSFTVNPAPEAPEAPEEPEATDVINPDNNQGDVQSPTQDTTQN